MNHAPARGLVHNPDFPTALFFLNADANAQSPWVYSKPLPSTLPPPHRMLQYNALALS